jgi:predicted GIY-YIG superfamily endonuclease
VGDSGAEEPIDWSPRAFRELGKPCICGVGNVDYTEAGRRFFPCCAPTYYGDALVALGPVWFDRAIGISRELTPEELRALVADAGTPPDGMTTALYRRFDADHRLLYVGITDDLPTRIRTHERRSAWSMFVEYRSVEWFSSRELAAIAEVVAIREEMPLFNQKHATPEARAALIEYLSENGRLGLIAAVQAGTRTRT